MNDALQYVSSLVDQFNLNRKMKQQENSKFRPHSAKAGYRLYRAHSHVQNELGGNHIQKYLNKKAVKAMGINATNNDFARILPRKIQQDKERLYSQALQLKENLNQYVEENTRLKTKILFLEREKEKVNKLIEFQSGQRASKINPYPFKQSQKDNMIIRNLKRMVKDAKQQNDSLQQQSQKIKKMMKYTKINEFQIEKKMIISQNKRLNALLEQYRSRLTDYQEIQQQNLELKRYLEQELEDKQQAEEQKEQYEELISKLQDQIKSEKEKYEMKQKRILKDYNTEKRRAQQLLKRNEDLVRQVKYLKESQQRPKYGAKNSRNNSKDISKVNIPPYNPSFQWQNKYNDMRFKNEKLQQQLSKIKGQLKNAQSHITRLQEKQKSNSRFHIDVSQLQRRNDNQLNTVEKYQEQESHQYHQQYDEQYQNKESMSQDAEHIQNYKKDFQEENQQVQQLYKIQVKKPNSQNNQSQKKSSPNKHKFQPNKKILTEIKQLLTYRMKAQRYPYSDIKSDIESAEAGSFSYIDLCNMLVSEPFYLTSHYTKVFLTYCFEKEKIDPSDSISNGTLTSKLRKVVDNFELMDQQEQKEMIIKIAEMTSAYPNQLQLAFEDIKNGQQTVPRGGLIELFRKLQLEDKYIELIICELSLCSDDLEHLNFHGFFERFYIEDDQYSQNNAIEEQGQESQQSRKYSSRIKKQSLKKSKIQIQQPVNENHSD